MSKAHGIKFFALATIVFVAVVVMFAGIHTFAAAEAGPQIGYDIDGTGWSAEKDVTITVDSAIELSSVTINGADASSYLVSGDNYSREYLYTADESANIVIVATDVNTDSTTITIYASELFIDTADPEFTAEVTGTANAWTSQDVLITFTQTGSVASGYTYYQSKDGGAYAEISGNSITYTASSSNGEYAYKAISGAGLEYSLPATYDVMIDKTSPVAPTTDLTTAYYTSQTVTFDVLFTSDGLSGETIYYTIDGSRPNSGSSTLVVGENSVNFGSDGTKTLRLIAIDAVGHESSVRSYLVKIDSTDYTVSFTSDPALGGTLEGDGTYKRGDTVTLSATPNAGYEFLSITEGGIIVSYDSEFLFEIDSDRTFVANFRTLIDIDYTESEFTYDGNPKAIDSYLTYDPTGDYSGITTITYNGSASAPTNAGNYNVIVTVESDDYYGYLQFTMTIGKALAEFTVDNLTQTYGNVTAVEVTVTTPPAGANVTILYNGSTSLPVNAGNYPLKITVTSSNYYAESIGVYTLIVEKADVTIALDDKTVTYNGETVNIDPASSVPGNLIVYYEYRLSGVLQGGAPTNAGTYTVKAKFDGDGNYNAGESDEVTLIINRKQLDISGTAVTQVKTYDRDASAAVTSTGSLIGIISGDDVTVNATAEYNSMRVLDADTITVTFTLSGDDADNYIKPDDTVFTDGVDGEVGINPLQLTVNNTIVTTIKTYDGNVSAAVTNNGILNGVIVGDIVDFGVSANYNSKSVIEADIVTIVYTLSGADKDNYVTPITYDIENGVEDAEVRIDPLQLTASDTLVTSSKEYDGNVTATVTDDGILSGVLSPEGIPDDVGFDSSAVFNSKNVIEADTVTVSYTLSGEDKDNYIAPISYNILGASITPKQLNAIGTTVDSEKVYDGTTDAEVTNIGTPDGIIDPDDVDFSVQADYNSKNVTVADTITVVYSLIGEDKDNYSAPNSYDIVDGVGATVSISQRQLLMNTPTLTPKTYDGTTAAKANVNADLAHPLNKISGDVLTLDYDAVYDDYTVLGVSIVTVTYMITGGADASNYTPADDYVIHDATINPLLLTASGAVASTNKIYDGTSTSTVTSVGTLSGVLSPEGTLDDVTLGANANFCYKQGEAYFNTAQVLTATFVKITFYLEGEDISNYTAPVSPVPVAATISKRQLIINDPSLSLTKVYDGTTAVSVTPGALQNKIETDSLTITATASYNSANVASANTITVVYTLSGTSKDNYIKPINKVYNSGVSISKLAVNISYTGLEQAYDGSVKAVGAEIVNYDAVKHAGFTISLIYLDGESNPFTPQNAGTYYVSIDMVSYNANYTCIDTAEFVITPSETTLTIDDLTITYNGISPSLNITILNQLGNPIYGIDVVLTYYRYINANWQIVDWLTYVYDPLDWEEVEGDAPSRAGVYRVIGEIEEGSNYYSDQAEALLKINKAVASVTLIQSSLTQSYGYVTGVEINTNPSQSEGHPMSFIAYYDGSEDLPTNAGTYSVDVQLDDYNYYGATSGTFIITKTDANAYVVLISDNPIILYDSEEEEFYLDYQLSLNLTASDFDAYVDIPGLEELPVDIILKQSEIEITCIISAGTYSVTATINDNNIAGTLTITLIVNKIEGTIEYTPESVTYSNETVSASGATTAPEECSVTYKYSYDEGDTYIYDEPVNAGYYPILIEINDANYFGSIYSSITIEQADTEISLSATVTRNYSGIAIDLSSLPQFTGDEVISPELIFNYYDDELNLLPSPPLNAGIYTLVVSFMERDNFIHPDSNTAQITINRATPVVTLQNGAFAYDGTAKTLTAEVIPAIAIEPQYFYYVAEGEEGSYTKGELLLSAPINVGVYIVLATVDEDELNYAAATSNEATLIITLGIASITVPSTSRTIEYSGNPVESVLVTTDPEGLDVVFEFTQGGVPVTPLIPGVYSVKATIDNETYVGETTFELTITKQLISEFINFSENRTFEYNGYARPVSATVQDHSVNLIITYSATGYASTTTAPKNAGTYNVTATISDTLYQGNASTSMIINKKLLVITADDIEDAEYGVEYPRKYTAVGFIAGIDSKNSLTKEPTLRIINEANDVNTIAFDSSIVVGTYTLMPENATAVNYYFEYHSGTMTVIKTSLTVSANNATVIEGTRATPIITYTGFKWQDNATTVFGNNKPIIKYLQGENTLNSVLPITPGVYQIIPDGGVADNYTLTYEAATLTVQADSLENAGQSLLLTGSFHPDTDLIVTELEKGSDRYKAAMSAARDQSLLYLYQYGIYLSLEQGNEQLAELDGHTEYSIKVPDKLIDQEFTLLFIADDGTCTVQNYTIANGYATGTLTVTGGTLVFVRSINILLILAVLGGILLLIGIIFLSKYLKRLKEESPKELSQAISPVVAEPLEALEDEDAAFDAYLEKLVEENIQADPNIIPEEEPVPQAEQSPNEDEDDINLGVNEAEYTKEELQRLKEKARKAKHKSVEDRITEEIERRLVESLTENKKEIQLQEFVPSAAAAAQDIADNSDITDEYIIDNELFPNSNTISMEESQALYPGRGIRRVGPKVALEVCFESALNLAEDKYKYIYSEIKNTFNSYNGVESRMFKSGEAFKGGAAHALIRMRNGIPVVYMNIDVKYIPEGTVYTDRSAEPKYKDSPIEIIVDDGKQLTAARTIISALMIIGGLEHNDKYKFINYIDKYPKIENAIMDES